MLMVKLPEVHALTPERLRSFFLSVSSVGGLASVAITVPFVVLSPWLIPVLFGSAFSGSVPLVLILAIDSALLGLGLTAGPMFRTLDRTDLPIRVHLIVLLVGLPLAYVMIRTHGAMAAAFSYVGLTLALRLATNLICWRLLAR
jgi:O-antigen/teichoic acid export membrane protein